MNDNLPKESDWDTLQWIEMMLCYREAPGATPDNPDGILIMLAKIREELIAYRRLAELVTDRLDHEYMHHTNHVREWYGYVYDAASKLVHSGRVPFACPD